MQCKQIKNAHFDILLTMLSVIFKSGHDKLKMIIKQINDIISERKNDLLFLPEAMVATIIS